MATRKAAAENDLAEVKDLDLKEQLDAALAELAKIDINEDPEGYKAAADKMHKLGKQYNAERVTIRLPRARPGEDKYLYVGFNGTGYRIEKGKEIKNVPRAVAEIIAGAQEQEERAYDTMAQLSEEFDANSF